MGPVVKDSPPSSPGSEGMSSTGPGRRKRKSTGGGVGGVGGGGGGSSTTTPMPSASTTPNQLLLNNTKDEKDVKLFQNGIGAPHMLGNQLNPSSTMAQKMSDTLNQELEAHSIFTETSNSSNLIGPQLHSRVIASVRLFFCFYFKRYINFLKLYYIDKIKSTSSTTCNIIFICIFN